MVPQWSRTSCVPTPTRCQCRAYWAVRWPGSGRPALTKTDAALLEDLGQLLEPATKGDPMRPLRWVSKSHAKLAAALCALGHQVSKSTIPKLLATLQFRRQVNCKTLESVRNPDRDAQFEHINSATIAMQAAGKPVIAPRNETRAPRLQTLFIVLRSQPGRVPNSRHKSGANPGSTS